VYIVCISWNNKEVIESTCTVKQLKKKKSLSLSGRHSLTELRVICAIAGQWGKLTHQQCGLIFIYQNQSRKIKRVTLQ